MTEERAKWWRNKIELAAETMTDADAVEAVELFQAWQPDTEYGVDDRRQYGGKLYKCRQQHTSQDGWEPNLTPALWAVVDIEDGSREHPKTYSAGMELEQDLYYTEDGVLYVCIRSTGVPVYNPLAELIGIYVEVAEDV